MYAKCRCLIRVPSLVPSALGLAYLHTRSPVVVHRDIKSANVLPGALGVPQGL